MLDRSPTSQAPEGPPAAAAGAPTRDRTLDRLLAHVRGLVHTDGVAFLVVDRERRWIEPVADWFTSADLREAIQPGHRRPYDRQRPGLVEFALERDRPLLLPRIEAWEAAPDLLAAAMEALGEQRAVRIWESYRDASVIACPVKTAIGEPLGVLIVASLDPSLPLRAPELRTVEVLADLAALALQRAELLEAEGRRAREERLLKRTSEDVSASLELDEVYRRIVDHAARATGATKAVLTRFDSRANVLKPAAAVDLSDELGRRDLPLDRGMLGEVARNRRAYRTGAEDAAGLDASATRRAGIGSFMHAPIELGPRMFGVLTVFHEEEERFDDAGLELLVKLARTCAPGIANAIDFQRERRIARALTLGFVPESLPDVPGYETGLLYAPAANEPTGGDVYGAWVLPGGEVAILIGDVAGKGLETAALSAMVRFFIEARSWDSPDACVVLSEANAMLLTRLPSDTFVTAFLGLLTPGRLRYCNAGHLPPLVVSGQPEPLEGHGLPLGIDDSPGYVESELRLEPGDLMFAYTDGLLEARSGAEVFGLERLTELVAGRAREGSPQDLVRTVHDEISAWAGGLTDDAVAMAVRRRRN
jgi:GAF domain-containing protein